MNKRAYLKPSVREVMLSPHHINEGLPQGSGPGGAREYKPSPDYDYDDSEEDDYSYS